MRLLEKRTEVENEIMKIYNTEKAECTLLHLGTPMSNLKTNTNASGKRPPDEAHGPGDETIRPQRSSVAWRSSEKKVHKARCADSASKGCTESKRYMPVRQGLCPDGANRTLLCKNG